MKNRCIFFLLLLVSIQALGDEKNTQTASVTRPPAIKACETAYLDFNDRIALINLSSPSELGRFVSDINNYRITINNRKETFEVQFSPQQFRGSSLRGGGARYVLDAAGEKILKFEPYR